MLKGAHFPKVKVYLNKSSGAAYQVCEQAGLFRCTEIPGSRNDVLKVP